jgi:hypothetical protein
MALFTTEQLKTRAYAEILKSGETERFSSVPRGKRVENKLITSINEQKEHSSLKTYDIFLSHSSKDAELVQGLKLSLEDLNYTVYIDWIDDPQLDRSRVTKSTALVLQQRMRQSKSLIYAYTENGSMSKWMPWELGYFDGLKNLATVLPIVESSYSDYYSGSEFLGIYNYVVINGNVLYVHADKDRYVGYYRWITGSKP